MADIMMIVDSAVVTPVNRLPLIDDTDFKTIESAVAYNAAGMDLRWNFVTAAGVQTSTAVTPTTAGSYDWTHMGDGIYSMEIPASGGASANNDTEGFGWWSGVCTGVLPWAGPIIQFSPANIVNGLVTGTDKLDVNAAELGGTSQTGRDIGASVLLSSGTGTGQILLSSGKVVTPDDQKVDLNTIKTQALTASGGITFPAATLASTTNITAGTITTASNLTTNNDKTGYSLTATTGLGNQTANITGNLSGSVGSVTGDVGGNVTGSIGSIAANAIDATALATTAVNEIRDAIFARVITELTGDPTATPTFQDAVALSFMATRNKRTTTATEDKIHNSAGSVVLTAAVSDDTTTFEKAKYA